MVTVIFPAAGQGKRMISSGVNKAFLELAGRPVLFWTLEKFSKCDEVDRLIVVVRDDEVEFVEGLLKKQSMLKPWQVVAGGSERQYSVFNGVKILPKDTDVVLVHDAARPFVSDSVIKEVISVARKDGAAIAAVPEKNTIKVVSGDNEVISTLDRSTLWAVQTPQGFRREFIESAYQKADEDVFLGTDDASLVERIGVSVKVVMSDYRNIKLTTPEDLIIGEALLTGVPKDKLTVSSTGMIADFKKYAKTRAIL